MSSARRDIVRHLLAPTMSPETRTVLRGEMAQMRMKLSYLLGSNYESSDEDHSQKRRGGNGTDEDEVVAAGAGFLDLVDDIPTTASEEIYQARE